MPTAQEIIDAKSPTKSDNIIIDITNQQTPKNEVSSNVIDLLNNIDTPNNDAPIVSLTPSSCGLFYYKPPESFVCNETVKLMCKPFLSPKFDPSVHCINGKDYPLYLVLDAANNSSLFSLVQNKNGTINKFFQINLSHTCLENSQHYKKTPHTQAIIDSSFSLLHYYFKNDHDRTAIMNCLNASNILSILYKKGGKVEVISLISFVFDAEGIFVNWTATSNINYNSLEFTNGDNKPFFGRGICSLLFRLLWQIGCVLHPTHIHHLRIMLQVNSDEKTAITFYKKRGFVFFKDEREVPILPEFLLKFKPYKGQYVHWVLDLHFGYIYKEPEQGLASIPPLLGLQQLLLASPKLKNRPGGRSNNIDKEVFDIFFQKVYETFQFKSTTKVSDIKIHFGNYYFKLIIDLKLPEIWKNGDFVIGNFPPIQVNNYLVINSFGSNTDYGNFFNEYNFLLRSDMDYQKSQQHLLRAPITINNLCNCWFGTWLKEGTINIAANYLLKNYVTTSQFLYWNAGVLSTLLNMYETQIKGKKREAYTKETESVFGTIYKMIVGSIKKKKQLKYQRKLYGANFWLIPFQSNRHWILIVVARPNNLFNKPQNSNEAPVVMYFDSLNENPKLIKKDCAIIDLFLQWAYIHENKGNKGVDTKKVSKTAFFTCPSYVFKTWKQSNSDDCGVFVIINIREFILYVIKMNKPCFLFSHMNSLPHYFGKDIQLYNCIRVTEIRLSLLILFFNISINRSKWSVPVNNIFSYIKSGFLSAVELDEISKQLQEQIPEDIFENDPITELDMLPANLSKAMNLEGSIASGDTPEKIEANKKPAGDTSTLFNSSTTEASKDSISENDEIESKNDIPLFTEQELQMLRNEAANNKGNETTDGKLPAARAKSLSTNNSQNVDNESTDGKLPARQNTGKSLGKALSTNNSQSKDLQGGNVAVAQARGKSLNRNTPQNNNSQSDEESTDSQNEEESTDSQNNEKPDDNSNINKKKRKKKRGSNKDSQYLAKKPKDDIVYYKSSFYLQCQEQYLRTSAATLQEKLDNIYKPIDKTERKKHWNKRRKLINDRIDTFQQEKNEVIDKINKAKADIVKLKKLGKLNNSTYMTTKLEQEIKDSNIELANIDEKIEIYQFLVKHNNYTDIRYIPSKLLPHGKTPGNYFVCKIEGREIRVPQEIIEYDINLEYLFWVMDQQISGKYGGEFILPTVTERLEKPMPIINDEQIASLKYVRKDLEGKLLPKPIWLAGFRSSVKKTEQVNEAWVYRNFSKKYLTRIIQRNDNRFYPIPAGDVKDNVDDKNLKKEIYLPEIKYKQNEESYCLGYSLASCLFHFNGDEEHARYIAMYAGRWSNAVDYEELVEYTNKRCDNYVAFSLYEKYNPVHCKSIYPTLLVLAGSDGGIGHAVATLNDLVFDSNLTNAQLITQEVFDWCVSTKEKKETFQDIHWGMRLVPKPVQNRWTHPLSRLLFFMGLTELSWVYEKETNEIDIFDVFLKNKLLSKMMFWTKLNLEKLEKNCYLVIQKSDTNIPLKKKQYLIVGHWLLQSGDNKYKIISEKWIKDLKQKKIYKLNQRPDLKENFKLEKIFVDFPELQYGL